MKPISPSRNTRRRPNRSARPLPTSSRPASETRNASSTHCSSPMPASRSFDNVRQRDVDDRHVHRADEHRDGRPPDPISACRSTPSCVGCGGAKWMKPRSLDGRFPAEQRDDGRLLTAANSSARPTRRRPERTPTLQKQTPSPFSARRSLSYPHRTAGGPAHPDTARSRREAKADRNSGTDPEAASCADAASATLDANEFRRACVSAGVWAWPAPGGWVAAGRAVPAGGSARPGR